MGFDRESIRASNARSALRTRLRSSQMGAQAAAWEAEDQARESRDAGERGRLARLADRARERRRMLGDLLSTMR